MVQSFHPVAAGVPLCSQGCKIHTAEENKQGTGQWVLSNAILPVKTSGLSGLFVF